MTSFRSDDENELARMESMTEQKPASELSEVTEVGQVAAKKGPAVDFKTRLAAIKARANAVAVKVEAVKPSEQPTPQIRQGAKQVSNLGGGIDPSLLTPLEADIEADRTLALKVTDENVEKASEKMLTAEALFTESLAEKSMDRDRFKAVFINTVQQECAGLTLEQIEDSIRRDHEVLFDKRTGIQVKLAYRSELLKDATAEERAKRLKDDWLFKPAKKVAAEKTTGTSAKTTSKKPAFDPAAAMRAALKAQGKTDEQIKTALSKFGL